MSEFSGSEALEEARNAAKRNRFFEGRMLSDPMQVTKMEDISRGDIIILVDRVERTKALVLLSPMPMSISSLETFGIRILFLEGTLKGGITDILLTWWGVIPIVNGPGKVWAFPNHIVSTKEERLTEKEIEDTKDSIFRKEFGLLV